MHGCRRGVGLKLKEWWESIPNRTSGNFVAEFGKAFGDFEHNLACGVDTEDQCVNLSCEGLFNTLFLLFFPFSSFLFCLSSVLNVLKGQKY